MTSPPPLTDRKPLESRCLKKAAGSFTGSYKSSKAANVPFQDPRDSNGESIGN